MRLWNNLQLIRASTVISGFILLGPLFITANMTCLLFHVYACMVYVGICMFTCASMCDGEAHG